MQKSPEAKEDFDIQKSPIREAYILLGARSPLELSTLYDSADQELWKSDTWDCDNEILVVNQIRKIIESCDVLSLAEDEREWRNEILWFWYHHATSYAIWKLKDKKRAISFVSKALEYQSEDHPNKITRLLSLLLDGKIEEANKLAEGITEEPEMSTSSKVIGDYEELGDF
jgi:hypothetical protein